MAHPAAQGCEGGQGRPGARLQVWVGWSRALQRWRVVCSILALTAARRCCRHRPTCSDATGPPAGKSRLGALQEESETAHRLFDNARLPPEAAAEAGGSSGAAPGAAAAAEAAAADALESTGVGRAVSALGNALFFGGLAAASFFGYYTLKYEVDQVRWGWRLKGVGWRLLAWPPTVALHLLAAAALTALCPALRLPCRPQVERMVEETETNSDNAFPGSSVSSRGLAQRFMCGFGVQLDGVLPAVACPWQG